MNDNLSLRLFLLPEYDLAQARFIHESVRQLMNAKDQLWASLRNAEPTEAVPTTQNTMPSGDVVQSAPIEIAAEFIFKYDEIRSCDIGALAAQVDSAADQALSVIMPRFFEMLRRTNDAAGTGINLGDRPPSFEILLEMLSKMPIDFDDHGQPEMPTLVMGPDAAEQIRNLPPPTPTQRKALADLIDKKRREFNARRRDRKLR